MADRLTSLLPGAVARLSQDNFYLDRSHLSPARRALLNFDNPRSIDWEAFGSVLSALGASRSVLAPEYDFATHCRRPRLRVMKPAPFLIVDGLWLFLRPKIRRLFTFKVFIHCPARVRLERRLSRDTACRGRTAISIKHQFQQTVEPMHRKFVISQKMHADLVVSGVEGEASVKRVMSGLRDMSAKVR